MDKFKQNQRDRKAGSRTERKMQNMEKVRQNENKWNEASRTDQRSQNVDKFKKNQNQRQKLSRGKRKVDELRELQNKYQRKHRRVVTKGDRLKEFREATKYNAIFICTCCHQRMFHSNVQTYTLKIKEEINRLKPGLIDCCIIREIKIMIEGKESCYICLTCLRHLKKKKVPPMSATNGLLLSETDQMIKDQNLQLTELEAALIAKTIIFQKIHQLPKSRWTALKDKVINIPINNEDIINTLDQLPRTPKDAGLIGVALKRKLEYSNTHKHQLIDPKKLFNMLEKLKKNNNTL